MFDRADTHTGLGDQCRGEARVVHERRPYRHLVLRRQVGAAEHDAGIRCSRVQGQLDPFSGVQPNASGADGLFQRALQDHDVLSDISNADSLA